MTKKKTGKLEDFELGYEDMPEHVSNKGNIRKYLTKRKKRSIIDLVKKLKRKDEKMANDKTKKSNSKASAIKSVAWLNEAAFRAFVGWALLTHLHNVVVTAAAFYALGTGAVIVVIHFIKANR